MHDCLLEAPDDALALQSAATKRADHARVQERQFMQTISNNYSSPQERLQATRRLFASPDNSSSNISHDLPQNVSMVPEHFGFSASGSAAGLMEHWRDRVRALPEMRSALIMLDESVEGSGWSNAFSLFKADLEPWLSFYSGYKKSALFAAPVTSFHAQAAGQPVTLQLQYEVQAIVELKGMDKKLILEPPVQINRPVEYLDLISELNACRDPRQAQELAKVANEVHDKLLAEATKKGREMGDRLYHALLGPDLINLSKEWQKQYQRVPNAEELCCMLTTGRIKIIPAKRFAAPNATLREEKPASRRAPIQVEKPRQEPVDAPKPKQPPEAIVDIRQSVNKIDKPQQNNTESTNRKTELVTRELTEEQPKLSRLRRVFRHLCQVSIGCVALITHAFAG